ncbi:hypothetical protein AMJ48_00055 [Parcubacteria bacterium DG_74_1]|nr:MAG: hypothetical protein AMJ48_00055 [Parcubacteria bacterium DG_74_1]
MRLHLLFFISIITLWSLSLYFYNNPVLLDALEWLKIAVSLAIVVFFALFCFIIIASKSSLKKFKIPLVIVGILVLAIILALFVEDPLGIKNYLRDLSPEAIILLLFLFIYTGLGIAILFERTLPSSIADHLQTIYVLIAFGLFVIAITVIYFFIPLITESREYLLAGPPIDGYFSFIFYFGAPYS